MRIIEISEDKVATDYGVARFKGVSKMKRTHCNFCWLRAAENGCKGVPCGKGEPHRSDGLVGVFTIQNFPINRIKKQNQ